MIWIINDTDNYKFGNQVNGQLAKGCKIISSGCCIVQGYQVMWWAIIEKEEET
jgi:hypothetical protein